MSARGLFKVFNLILRAATQTHKEGKPPHLVTALKRLVRAALKHQQPLHNKPAACQVENLAEQWGVNLGDAKIDLLGCLSHLRQLARSDLGMRYEVHPLLHSVVSLLLQSSSGLVVVVLTALGGMPHITDLHGQLTEERELVTHQDGQMWISCRKKS